MALSQDLVSQFAKLTNSEPKQNKDTTVNGTYKLINGKEYVQIDGSDIWTPVTSTVEAETGERVTVLLKDHTATVTGNISSPSARTKTVQNLKDEVDEHGNTIKQLDNSITQQGNSIIQINNNIKQQGDTINSFGNTIDSQNNKIQQIDNTIIQHGDSITSMNNTITQHSNQITSMNNTIDSQNNTIKQQGDTILSQGNIIVQQGNLISQQGNTINQHNTTLETVDSDIKILNSGFNIQNGVLTGLSEIIVDELETNTLNAKYANIDFANINMAAVEKLFSDSGIIKDLIVSEGKITGELVGVTIKGDLIEGNTVKADKLVVRGEDGIYYKLNVDSLGEATASSDEKYQNGLDGSVIVAKSLTADKVAVTDLVAFGATIGGFHIDSHSLYSGAKNSAANTARGVFLGDDGQMAVGDSNNYLRYFKDTDGNYKLEIAVSGSSIVTKVSDIEKNLNNLDIGGRNYILNSQIEPTDFGKNTKMWSGYGTYTYQEDYKSDFCAAHATNKWSGIGVYLNQYVGVFDIDEEITLSVTVDNDSEKDLNIGYYNMQFDNNGNRLYNSNYSNKSLGTIPVGESKRLSVTIPVEQSLVDIITNGGTSRLTIQIESDQPCSAYLYAPKLEKGNKATDWTLAIEDVNEDISDAHKAANTAQSTADNTQTTITEVQSTITQLSNMIANMIVDEHGSSLMTQTSDGWTFNMSTISGNLEAVQNALINMKNEQNDTNNLLEKLTDLVDSVTKKTAYITMNTDENGDPCIELGKSDNEFKLRITNTAIDFLEGSSKMAYANNNTFYSIKIITEELQIGRGPGFVWQTRSNGNFGLTPIEG